MIYYPQITRICCQAILREERDAWKVRIGGEEFWIPRRQATLTDYFNKIFEVESWFVRQCLYDVCIVKRKTAAPPLDELVSELSYPPTPALTSQTGSREHQREAFDKLRDSKVFALMMKCRTGKTKIGVDLACQHVQAGHVQQVLWLCPVSVIPTARWQWGRFAQVDLAEPDRLRFFGTETLSACKRSRFGELMTWVLRAPTMCVIDESHMIKTWTAKRSKRAERLAEACQVRGIMSGSPITRDIRDIFWPFFVLDRHILGYHSRYQFDRRHIEYSSKYPGLVARTMNEGYIVKRTRPFTYEYFPPDNAADTHQTLTVEMSEDQRRWYDWVKEKLIEKIKQSDEARIDIYLLFVALQSVLSGYLSRSIFRHIDGAEDHAPVILPSPKTAALLDDRIGVDGRCIVWCSRRYEVESMADLLPETYVVTGKDRPARRHEIIQAFRASACGTLIAMVQVAKRGIDIFEADTAYFYGQSFDFESREQAWYRIQAPGIKETPCHYVDMVFQDSLDERILSSHGRKENIIRSFLDLMKKDRDKAIEEMRKL
jgi:hypothetical protein